MVGNRKLSLPDKFVFPLFITEVFSDIINTVFLKFLFHTINPINLPGNRTNSTKKLQIADRSAIHILGAAKSHGHRTLRTSVSDEAHTSVAVSHTSRRQQISCVAVEALP